MLGAVWKSALIKNTAIMTRIEKIDHVRRAFLLKKLPKPQLCPHPPSGAGTCGAIDQTWGVGWGLGQHPWVRGGVGGEQSPPWCWGVQGRGGIGVGGWVLREWNPGSIPVLHGQHPWVLHPRSVQGWPPCC